MLIRLFLLCLLVSLMPACQNPPEGDSSGSVDSLTLLEEQLLRIIGAEARLDQEAARPDADARDVQRLFQQISYDYLGIIARNPDHLESHLLYGKLLLRFGDGEGARDQFLMAARIDPNIAVIHQQLGTYYAEEGDYTRALAFTLNALELEPETAAYHFGLGQLLVAFAYELLEDEVFTEEQIDEEILRAFRTAKALEPETLALAFRYGEAFYDIADPDWTIALAHWESLAGREDLSPLHSDAIRLHRARSLLELNREEEAKALIEEAHSPALRATAESISQGDNNPPTVPDRP